MRIHTDGHPAPYDCNTWELGALCTAYPAAQGRNYNCDFS